VAFVQLVEYSVEDHVELVVRCLLLHAKPNLSLLFFNLFLNSIKRLQLELHLNLLPILGTQVRHLLHVEVVVSHCLETHHARVLQQPKLAVELERIHQVRKQNLQQRAFGRCNILRVVIINGFGFITLGVILAVVGFLILQELLCLRLLERVEFLQLVFHEEIEDVLSFILLDEVVPVQLLQLPIVFVLRQLRKHRFEILPHYRCLLQIGMQVTNQSGLHVARYVHIARHLLNIDLLLLAWFQMHQRSRTPLDQAV
jgi:hypothetical protein